MTTRAFPLLVAASLVATLGAGCLGGNEARDANPREAASNATVEQDAAALANITDTGEGTMNASMGHMPHLHDYWEGRERVTILDEDVTVDERSLLFFTFFNAFREQSPSLGGVAIGLPDGATVYEGTGQVEVTVSWEEPTITAMAVRVRSAAGPEFSEPNPLASGTALAIPVTPEMSDMPHVSASRWRFLFTPGDAGNAIYGTFHVKVDVVKMRDIALFPGHPELFAGASEKILLDANGKSAQQNGLNQFVSAVSGGGDPSATSGVQSQEIVPMETLEMRVDLTINSVTTASGGEAQSVELVFKSAETNRWRSAELLEGDVASGKLVFAIPVEMSMVDSPYAKESDWWFDVRVSAQAVPGTDTACRGCTDAQVDYHVTVTAFDHNVALEPGTEPDDDRLPAVRSPAFLATPPALR